MRLTIYQWIETGGGLMNWKHFIGYTVIIWGMGILVGMAIGNHLWA